MRDINRILLVGHLGQKPELKTSQSGKEFTILSVATHRGVLQENGEWGEKTDWHEVICWEKQAAHCVKYLDRGSPVCVEGVLQNDIWKDEDGKTRKSTKIRAQGVKFLGMAPKQNSDEEMKEAQ
jgi:single-strand DNA-binding protein